MRRLMDRLHDLLTCKWGIVISVALTLMLGALAIFLRTPIIGIGSFVLLGVAMACLHEDERILVLIYVLFYSAFLSTFFSTFGTLTLLVLLEHFVMCLIEHRKELKEYVTPVLIPGILLTLLFIYSFVIFFWRQKSNWASCVTYAAYFAFPLTLVSPLTKRPNLEKVSFTALIALLTSSLMALGLFILPFTKASLLEFVGDSTYYPAGVSLLKYRFSGLCVDPNEFGMLVLLSISIPLCNLNKITYKKTVIALCIALVLLGFLSQSKSFLICLVILLLVLGVRFVLGLSSCKIGYVALGVGGVFVVGLFAMLFMGTSGINAIFGRFLEDNYDGNLWDNITTGRMSLWRIYFTELSADPLGMAFGYGVKASYSYQLPEINVSHNYYLNLLWDFGFVGTTLFLGYIVSLVLSMHRVAPRSKAHILLPIVVFLLDAFSLTLTGNVEPMLITSLALLAYYDQVETLPVKEKKEKPGKVRVLPVDDYSI